MTHAKQLTQYMEWLFSFCIRARDGFICQLHGKDHLGCGGVLQAAHIITRGVKGIKYDFRNARCLCQKHHTYYSWKPEYWATICSKLWTEDWLYLNQKKWQHPDTAIDREARFSELMVLAVERAHDYPEFFEKIEAIQKWMGKQTQKEAT